MKVKDQLRLQMERMHVSVKELSERLDVSDQTVRHWLSGRSFPGKSKTAALDQALNFKIDYSEGAVPTLPSDGRPEAPSVGLSRTDIETLMAISRMPPDLKLMLCRLAEAIVQRLDEVHDRQSHVGDSIAHTKSPFRKPPPR